MPLKKESSCYLFCKTKPRHSSQIFLTVRMIEEGWYFIGQSLACALALTRTQWLQSRRGNCMCQCPKKKKQTGFIIAMFWNSVITWRLYATLQAQRDWLGGGGGEVWLFIYWYSSSWNAQLCEQEMHFLQDGRKQMDSVNVLVWST